MNTIENILPKQLTFNAYTVILIETLVLEHLEQPGIVLKNIKICMRENSLLIVTVPGGPLSAYKKNLGHLRHYTKNSLRNILELSGLRVISTLAAGFPFFNLYEFLIMLRGERLIGDVDSAKEAGYCGMPLSVRFSSAVLRCLMSFNLDYTPWGWQIIAIARKDERDAQC
ncbi:MAG: class I SAM-dependent methyltransferase [Synergistaceae bacterium]|jgi:hypothetical protein|nr:class I SAM-dependent methyltransferase [Synergistaceae bacterium]